MQNNLFSDVVIINIFLFGDLKKVKKNIFHQLNSYLYSTQLKEKLTCPWKYVNKDHVFSLARCVFKMKNTSYHVSTINVSPIACKLIKRNCLNKKQACMHACALCMSVRPWNLTPTNVRSTVTFL